MNVLANFLHLTFKLFLFVWQLKGLGHSENAANLLIELEEVTTETIDNSLIFGGNIKIATQVLSTVSNFISSHQKESFNQNELKVRFDTIQ